MKDYKKEIQEHICYTDLVYGRINKKLNIALTNDRIEEMVLNIIRVETDASEFIKKGKNIYITSSHKNVQLTINSYTYRIITADRLNKKLPVIILPGE